MQIDDQPFYAWERPQTPEMIAVRLMRLTIRVLMMMRRIIALRLVTMTMILIMIMVTMMVIALLLNAAAADDGRKNALRLTMMRLIALRQAG